MVNVSDRPYVHMRFGPRKDVLSHRASAVSKLSGTKSKNQIPNSKNQNQGLGIWVLGIWFFFQKLLLGLEPRTSSLPRTRSTAELQQRALLCRFAPPVLFVRKSLRSIEPRLRAQAGEGNRTLVIGLEDRC